MAEGNQQEKITYSKIGRVEGPGSPGCEGANVLPSLSSPSLLCQRPPPFSLLLQLLHDQPGLPAAAWQAGNLLPP